MQTRHADHLVAKRLLDGDERAFKELFDDYFPKLYRFALTRMRGDRDTAAEAVQQTFCKAFEHLDSYRGEASLYGWMCQICRNVIADDARRRQREGVHVELVEDDSAIRAILESVATPDIEQPEQQAVAGDLRRLIQATLDALPGHYGDVLEWKYVDGLSVEAIAARLVVGPKAAESLLTRARAAFRETMTSIGDATLLPTVGAARPPRGSPS